MTTERRSLELEDTASIKQFMTSYGQKVRTTPTADVTPQERVLRAALPLEEVFELIAASGLRFIPGEGVLGDIADPKDFTLEINESLDIDLTEVADAFADIIVVAKGGALTYGIPVDEIVVDEVGPSNMSKLGEDGLPIYHPETGKIMKGPNTRHPDLTRFLVTDL